MAGIRIRRRGQGRPRHRARHQQTLVAATITYNIIEAVVAIAAGSVASSTEVIGFGLDSVVEVVSAAAVAWQFSGKDPEARERAALKVIAVSFFALAAYVTVESVHCLLGAGPPSTPRSASCWPLGQRGCGLQADPAVHLPVRRAAGRAAGQLPVRLVLG